MFSRTLIKRSFLGNQLRTFSSSKFTSLDLKSLNNVSDTIDHISNNGDSDTDLKSHKSYIDIIDHHASKLENNTSHENLDKEYNDLYTLSLKLSQLLENTPDVPETSKKEILNRLIERFTKYNYAVSTLAFKKLLNDKNTLSHESINQLISHNPGRVHSSWDLYNSLKPNESHDTVLVSLFQKLILGDPVEIKEGLEKIDLEKLIKILNVYENIADKSLIDDQSLTILVKELINLDCTAIITQMCIPSSIIESLILDNADDKNNIKNIDYLFFYEASINNGISLSGNALLNVFMPISKLQLSTLIESDNLKLLKEKLGINIPELAPLPEVVDEIREQIQELALDDTSEVMINLIKSAGFHSKDLPTAIKYFQHYQSKIPDGTLQQNDLKSAMSLVFVYDCIYKNDPKMVNVAEALVPQTPLPAANNLGSLIMFHAWFGDSDKAFDIYNQALDLFLKPHEGNESNRGILVQSLVTVSLLGKELGLANLIKEKSLENDLLDETYEIKLSNLFKEYGDKCEEYKDEVEFREAMKAIILRTIMEFSP